MATMVMVRMAMIVVAVVMVIMVMVLVVLLTVTWLAGGECRPASLGSVPTVSLTGSNHQEAPQRVKK